MKEEEVTFNDYINYAEKRMGLLSAQMMSLSLALEYVFQLLIEKGIEVDPEAYQAWAEKRSQDLMEQAQRLQQKVGAENLLDEGLKSFLKEESA